MRNNLDQIYNYINLNNISPFKSLSENFFVIISKDRATICNDINDIGKFNIKDNKLYHWKDGTLIRKSFNLRKMRGDGVECLEELLYKYIITRQLSILL